MTWSTLETILWFDVVFIFKAKRNEFMIPRVYRIDVAKQANHYLMLTVVKYRGGGICRPKGGAVQRYVNNLTHFFFQNEWLVSVCKLILPLLSVGEHIENSENGQTADTMLVVLVVLIVLATLIPPPPAFLQLYIILCRMRENLISLWVKQTQPFFKTI